MKKIIIKTLLCIIIIFSIFIFLRVLSNDQNRGASQFASTLGIPYTYPVYNPGENPIFVHNVSYELEIWTVRNSIIEGGVRDGFNVTVEAGDTIYVITRLDGNVIDSANDIWFVLNDVKLGNYTDVNLGFRIACDYVSKWFDTPTDAEGTLTIGIFNQVDSILVTNIYLKVNL